MPVALSFERQRVVEIESSFVVWCICVVWYICRITYDRCDSRLRQSPVLAPVSGAEMIPCSGRTGTNVSRRKTKPLSILLTTAPLLATAISIIKGHS